MLISTRKRQKILLFQPEVSEREGVKGGNDSLEFFQLLDGLFEILRGLCAELHALSGRGMVEPERPGMQHLSRKQYTVPLVIQPELSSVSAVTEHGMPY